MKKTYILAIIICLLILIILISIFQAKPAAIINAKTIYLELAKTEKERQTGLMNRKSLNANSGMFFIFPDEKTRYFWMKNTLIPLDMIFIDKNHYIVDIKNALPCKSNSCINYISKLPAKYVLEVNNNYTKMNNISIGTKVELRNIE